LKISAQYANFRLAKFFAINYSIIFATTIFEQRAFGLGDNVFTNVMHKPTEPSNCAFRDK
jgi:hypothetical protein